MPGIHTFPFLRIFLSYEAFEPEGWGKNGLLTQKLMAVLFDVNDQTRVCLAPNR